MPSGESNRLNFYFFPSPYGTDWSSPGRLALSALKNRFSLLPRPLHPLGHVNIEGVNSAGERQFLTGMVTENTSDQLHLILRKHYGLGIFFHNFPGLLEHPDEVEAQFEKRFRTDKISVLSLKVSDSVLKRACNYLSAYVDELGYHSYGLHNRPLHLEGAGCSAFAASFLEITGLDHTEFRQNWSHKIRIHNDHLGGGHALDGHKKVPFLKLIRQARRWAMETEPHRELSFWSPDHMHQWLVKTWDRVHSGDTVFSDRAQRAFQIQKARALEFDFSDVTALPFAGTASDDEIAFHAKPTGPHLENAMKVRENLKKALTSHAGRKVSHLFP
ncbi:MAG: hypothetical protein JNL01_16820 [Bdellovibrionales bacterium]|nr:hypothetical protein [Bdellovibrionales bacterium]